jgi:hypothetical protein
MNGEREPSWYRESSQEYDKDLLRHDGLTWLPWVGRRWSELDRNERVFLLGESHYHKGDTPEENLRQKHARESDGEYTRKVIGEGLVEEAIGWEKPSKTFSNVRRMVGKSELSGRDMANRICYSNLVQRTMDYSRKPPERPTFHDFANGWKVLSRLIPIMNARYCVVLGVSSASVFQKFMANRQMISFTYPDVGKVNGVTTRNRDCEIYFSGSLTRFVFVRHPGSQFSWSTWHDYLHERIGITLFNNGLEVRT